MKRLHALMWVSVGVAGLGLQGCLWRGSATVYVEPQEPEYVIVREAPPPAVVELRPSPPSHLHIWIGGYWNWNGRYVWERGHWAVPPHEHAVWVEPRYEKHEQGYRYAPGHWNANQQAGAQGRGGDQRQVQQVAHDRPEHK